MFEQTEDGERRDAGGEESAQMSVNWERLNGDTNRFAVGLAFLPDPDDGAGVDVDTAISWGTLELWAGGQNLCVHTDQGETLTRVHWYLLPVLEWLAESWDPLLHEERLPVRNSGDDAASALFETRFATSLKHGDRALRPELEWYTWYRRHALRAARDGGLFPNLYVRRYRDQIELSWDDAPLPGTPPGFNFAATRGTVRLKPLEVAEPLYETVTAAVSALVSRAPASTRVRQLAERLDGLRLGDRRERRVAWLAGLPVSDPAQAPSGELTAAWGQVTERIRTVGSEGAARAALAVDASPLVITGSCQAALLFGAVAPTVTGDDVQALADVLIQQYEEGGGTQANWSFARPASLTLDEPAWQQGYDLAEELHDELQLNGSWIDIEAVLDQLGIVVLHRSFADLHIRAISLVGPHHVPTVVVNDRFLYGVAPPTRRFTLTHELCHLLFDRGAGQRLAVASGPWAPRGIEQRANAFAAMFLMPLELVERAAARISEPLTSIAGVRAVAQALGVGARAAVEHLYHLLLIDEPDRDSLVARLRSD